jgi:hypothetical protein
VTSARSAQSSQELESCVKIYCKECTDLEFDEESKRLHKEVEGQERKNARKARKDSFQESLDLSLTSFPEKKEVLGRSKPLERSSSGGVALSKKHERDPRNGLIGRIKVKAFKSFKNILSLKKDLAQREDLDHPISVQTTRRKCRGGKISIV